jgi:glycosidase
MLATFLLALRGTIFLYQGQELGISHPENWKIEDYKDVETLKYYERFVLHSKSFLALANGFGSEYKRRKAESPRKEPDMSDVMHAIKLKGRDNARTPMPWDTSPNSGFTGAGVKPWIKMNDKHSDINVMTQERDQESVLSYFKKLINIRKQHPLLVSHWNEIENY